MFPDGELHPIVDVLRAIENVGLEIRDVESVREHYGPTLRRWVANLNAHQEAAIREVGAQRERTFRLYMTDAADGFECGDLSVFQTLAVRPVLRNRLPLIRPSFAGQRQEATSTSFDVIDNGRCGDQS